MEKPDNLRELLSAIMTNYHAALTEPFTDHPVANMIRKGSKRIIGKIFVNPDLKIKGSPGIGQWTTSPWIAVFDVTETDGAQEGIYVVYLFSDDMQRVYLTFNQGVTRPKERYGKKSAMRRLQANASLIRAQYGHELDGFNADDNIELADNPPGSEYEQSTIFYKKYKASNLPSNNELVSELKQLVRFYERYLHESNLLTAFTDFSGSKGQVEEGKRKLVQHYTRERNQTIVKKAKQKRLTEQGELRCDVCGFCFEEQYGERGKNFIEAHHTKPLAEIDQVTSTKIEDIALVCSNCHRMIHVKDPHLTVDELVEIISIKK